MNKIINKVLISVILFFFVSGFTFAGTQLVLTFKAKRARPACTLTSNMGTTITLPNLSVSDFAGSNSNNQSKGVGFTLKLGNCTAAPGAATTKIAVYGDRDNGAGNSALTANSYLFRNAASTSKFVGFLFAYNRKVEAAGSQNNNWVSGTSTSMTNISNAFKTPAVTGVTSGVVPNDKTMDFFVSVSNTGQPANSAVAGTLTANVNFDVVFE